MFINVENMSIDEVLKIGTPEQIREKLENIQTEIELKNDELVEQSRSNEITNEQLYFAQTLVEEIAIVIDNQTRAKDIKNSIKTLISDSSLEL